MLSQILKIKGLHTDPSLVSSSPDGALLVAENIVLSRRNLAEPVRGMDRIYCDMPGLSDERVSEVFSFANFLVFTMSDNSAYKYSAEGGVVQIGKVKPFQFFKMESSGGNLYMGTREGVLSLSRKNDTLLPAGVGKPSIIDSDSSETLEESFGSLGPERVRAYRVVAGRKNGFREVLGAPSVMEVVRNDSEKHLKITLSVLMPSSAESGFYEIYSTADIASGELPADFIPEDEMYLLERVEYTSDNRTVVVYEDSFDRRRTGKTLYTSVSQEGLAAANDRPPASVDLCFYKGYLFFSNTRLRGNILFEPDLSVNSQFLLRNFIFEISDSERGPEDVDGRRKFYVKNGGENQTAKSLCRAIVENTNFFAQVVSAHYDTPEVYLELGFESFSLTLAHNNEIKKSIQSSSHEVKNGLRFSKYREPEAVPGLHFIPVGSDDAIQRIVSLRDSLVVFKKRGVYRLFGDDPQNFSTDVIDSTMNLVSERSIAVLNNTVFALTDQGVVIITETEASRISQDIEIDIQPLIYNEEALSGIVGLAYQSENRYYLFTEQYGAFIFHLKTHKWTTWRKAATCACIHKGRIALGSPRGRYLEMERKNFFLSDFIDYDSEISVSTYWQKRNVIKDPDKKARDGDFIYAQNENKYFEIIKVEQEAEYFRLFLDSEIADTTDTFHLHKPIRVVVEWLPFHGVSPAIIKQFQHIKLIFDDQGVKNLKASVFFKTDLNQTPAKRDFLVKSSLNEWGNFPWGAVPWGDSASKTDENLKPVIVPRSQQRGHRLTVRFEAKVIRASFELAGIAIAYRNISDKGIRYGSTSF